MVVHYYNKNNLCMHIIILAHVFTPLRAKININSLSAWHVIVSKWELCLLSEGRWTLIDFKKNIWNQERMNLFSVDILDKWLKPHRSQNLMNFKGSSKCTRFVGLLILGILSISGRYRPDKFICVVLLRRR